MSWREERHVQKCVVAGKGVIGRNGAAGGRCKRAAGTTALGALAHMQSLWNSFDSVPSATYPVRT